MDIPCCQRRKYHANMIEKIDGLPAGVDGYKLVGTITKDDCTLIIER